MTLTPRTLIPATTPPAVTVIPFRWACGEGHTYVAPGGTPDAVVFEDFRVAHEAHEDGAGR